MAQEEDSINSINLIANYLDFKKLNRNESVYTGRANNHFTVLNAHEKSFLCW